MPCAPLSEESVPALPFDIPAVATWNPAAPAPPLAPHDNIFMYNPSIWSTDDAEAARAVLHANQFPADLKACERALM